MHRLFFIFVTGIGTTLGAYTPVTRAEADHPKKQSKRILDVEFGSPFITHTQDGKTIKELNMYLVREQRKRGEPSTGHPIALFCLHRLGNKSRFVFFMLLKLERVKGHIGGPSVRLGASTLSVYEPDIKGTLTLEVPDDNPRGRKVIEYAFKFKADATTGAIVSESLSLFGTEYKKNIPRVFLVDLTQKKIACRPVKVAVPVLGKVLGNAGSENIIRTIENLKKNSPQVREFLQHKPKR